MARKQQGPIDATLMLRDLASTLKTQAVRPNLHGYVPHDKQLRFHSNSAKGRLYIGGNRSGKTVGGVTEDLFWLRGNHPHRPVPEPPVRARVVGPDFINGIAKILIPEFKRWTPPSLLKNGSWDDSYNKELRTLTLANGSFVEFMSYDQDTDKFAGTSRHFVHYDEEPPQHIFNECSARLIDTDGSWWMTMTPVEGMTWIYDGIYRPGIEGDPDISVVEIDMAENPYLDAGARERFLKTLDPEERKAREKGQFVQLGGRVFKKFSRSYHVVDETIPPKDWEWYISIDHGWNNPTAVLWHAVSPSGRVVTFAEHYASEMTIKEHATVIHNRNAGFGRVPDVVTGDPAMKQTTAVTGTSILQEYAEHGIYLAVDGVPRDVLVGVNKMSQYLQPDPETNKPRWTITANCVNLIREMERLRWKTWTSKKAQFENNPHDAIHKKDDHACDSARYFFTFLPDLAPEDSPPVVVHRSEHNNIAPVAGRYDEVLAKMQSSGTPWKIAEGTDVYSMEF